MTEPAPKPSFDQVTRHGEAHTAAQMSHITRMLGARAVNVDDSFKTPDGSLVDIDSADDAHTLIELRSGDKNNYKITTVERTTDINDPKDVNVNIEKEDGQRRIRINATQDRVKNHYVGPDKKLIKLTNRQTRSAAANVLMQQRNAVQSAENQQLNDEVNSFIKS